MKKVFASFTTFKSHLKQAQQHQRSAPKANATTVDKNMCVERHAPEAVKNVPYKELICAYKDPYKQKTRSSIELEGILQSYLSKIHIMSFYINTLIINPRFVPDLPHCYAFSYSYRELPLAYK